jgi:hypothetical protein
MAASKSEGLRGSLPLTTALTFDQQFSSGEKSGDVRAAGVRGEGY